MPIAYSIFCWLRDSTLIWIFIALLTSSALIQAQSQISVIQVATQKATDTACPASVQKDVLERVKYLERAFATLRANLELISVRLAHITHSNGKKFAPNPANLAAEVREQRLAIGLLQLSIIVRTDKPFVREFYLVQQLGTGEARLRTALDSLAPHAATGVATAAQLRDGFGLILLPKLSALAEGEQASWGRQTWSWFMATAVPVWKSNKPSPATELTQNIIGSAMDRLSEDDVRGAVNLLTQLNGPTARLTARWLVEARARISLDSAYESLSSTALALLGASN